MDHADTQGLGSQAVDGSVENGMPPDMARAAVDAAAVAARQKQLLWPVFNRPPVVFERGLGVRLWDTCGCEYLDFLGGIATVAAGHANPHVVAAACGQLGRLGHTSNLYFTGPQLDLAERLVDRFGAPSRVFFSNSGAEANEAALKLARRWGKLHRGDDATEIIAMDSSFHGRTFATLAATGKPAMHVPFQPLPVGIHHVPFGDAAAVAQAVNPRTAAVLVEPVQGEAGVRIPPAGYLRELREITRRAGVLLILDEIQSGMGRTGRLFAFEHEDARPDVVTLAKALGNGFPIGATIATEAVAEAMRPGEHASTFGGNPAACAAALATLDVIEPLLPAHVQARAEQLSAGLQAIADRLGAGAQVRAAGLWQALELGDDLVSRVKEGPSSASQQVALAALAQGLIVNPVTPTALRMAPPLVITEAEIAEGLDRLDRAIAAVASVEPQVQ